MLVKKRMFHRLELFVDRSIPYLFALLAVLILLDFTPVAEAHPTIIHWLDYLVLAFFVTDLYFKWYHARNAVTFVKLYWFDILAVFPFYLFFRLYFAARELVVFGEQAQKVAHELELVKEARLLREVQITAKEGRFVRGAVRLLRLLRLRWYVAHGHLRRVSRQYRAHHRYRTIHRKSLRNSSRVI